MRKIKEISAALCLCLLLHPAAAAAAEPEEAPSPTVTNEPEADPPPAVTEAPSEETKPYRQLQIDNENRYEHMDRAYQDGYDPEVTKDAVRILLPLTSESKVKDDRLRVSFDLGDPDAAPFAFKNFERTVSLKHHTVNGGKKETESWLIDVKIPLTGDHQAGRYPVAITVSGQWEDGSPISQEFLLYVTVPGSEKENPSSSPENSGTAEDPGTISQGGVPDAETTPEPTKEPPSQARVLLKTFSVNPSYVQAGESFEMTAVFLNTSDEQAMDNVKITVKEETGQIVPEGEETGSFYFKTIGKRKTAAVEMKMKAAHNAGNDPCKLQFTVEYEDKDGENYTVQEEAAIQVSLPLRLEFDEPQIPKEVNAGDTLSVSGNVMNLGLGTVYNVRMQVEAPGLLPEETAFLGNIESGSAQKGELYAFVGTLDSDETGETSGGEKYGDTDGKVIFLYEDAYGQEYKKEFAFATRINPPVILGSEEEETETAPKKQGQWWISVIGAGAALAAALGGRIYIKKKQERLRRQEEEQGDDLLF
jgi:hypothetical protein